MNVFLARHYSGVLAALVAFALLLRFSGLDWGAFHPDEWAISTAVYNLDWPTSIGEFFSVDSALNPKWFNYGSLPLYAFRGISETAAWLRPSMGFISPDVVLWRATSGLADVATLLLVAYCAKRLFGPTSGLLAALLYGAAGLPIQLSHFYTVDPLFTTFLTAATVASVIFVDTRSRRWGIVSAALLGLAVATKATGVLFAAPVVLAWVFVLAGSRHLVGRSVAIRLGFVILAGTAAIGAFALSQPYALIDSQVFLDDVLFQIRMARGVIELPYTIQYIDTAPFWYHIRNLVVWGLGIPLGVVGILGIGNVLLRGVFRERRGELLIAIAVVVPFLLLGAGQVKFMRYLLPIYPMLALAAAGILTTFGGHIGRGPRSRLAVPIAIVALILLPTVAYGVAVSNVYRSPHTISRMGEWARENIPPGSTVAIEAWDQGFPGAERFRLIQVSPYDADD
ncbi:MAG: glycosyltransferase family 39 protein, partial [Chloroflexi bacterium]|nr:glycosyltransferase family 39 protein [Chloroflexota bacterium]